MLHYRYEFYDPSLALILATKDIVQLKHSNCGDCLTLGLEDIQSMYKSMGFLTPKAKEMSAETVQQQIKKMMGKQATEENMAELRRLRDIVKRQAI